MTEHHLNEQKNRLINDTPLNVIERKIAGRLFDNDFTLEEGLKLYHSMVDTGRVFPKEWEIRVLELGLMAYPERQDLKDRLNLLSEGYSPVSSVRSDTSSLSHSAENKKIVSDAKCRMESVLALPNDKLPGHGKRWKAYAERTRSQIDTFTTPIEVLHFAQTKIGFEHRGCVQHEGKFTALYERELMSSFGHLSHHLAAFADIENSAPDTTYDHNGRPISNVLFYLARVILSCLTHLPLPVPKLVLEIGGGYGALARLWMRNPIERPGCYLLLDMPESLFFADVFLRNEFGDRSVFYLTSDETISVADIEKYRFILCPLSFFSSLLDVPIDLVINTGSIQEMTEEWVDFYTAWFDRQICRWFYSLNYFAQPIGALWESGNLWSPRLSPMWTARLLRWNPAFVRMQSDRDYLEAIYEKCSSPTDREAAWGNLQDLGRRMPCGEVFAEIMDIVRRFPDASFMYETLSFAMRMPVSPKEALWLAERLLLQPVAEHYRFDIERWHRELTVKRSLGVEEYY